MESKVFFVAHKGFQGLLFLKPHITRHHPRHQDKPEHPLALPRKVGFSGPFWKPGKNISAKHSDHWIAGWEFPQMVVNRWKVRESTQKYPTHSGLRIIPYRIYICIIGSPFCNVITRRGGRTLMYRWIWYIHNLDPVWCWYIFEGG